MSNNIQISALNIENNLTTNELSTYDIYINEVSLSSKLFEIDQIYKQKLILQVGDKQYMFFGRELED